MRRRLALVFLALALALVLLPLVLVSLPLGGSVSAEGHLGRERVTGGGLIHLDLRPLTDHNRNSFRQASGLNLG
jgi:hypothetical protein